MRQPYPNELYHHGVLGMKWGKRNGPPYPLSPGAHSAAEKKAGWEKSLDNGGRSLKGNLHRAAAANYRLNERTYSKLGNKTLASMNRAAAEESENKARKADAEARAKRAEKSSAKERRKAETQTKKEERAAVKESHKAETRAKVAKKIDSAVTKAVVGKILDAAFKIDDPRPSARENYRSNLSKGEKAVESIIYNLSDSRGKSKMNDKYMDLRSQEAKYDRLGATAAERIFYSNNPNAYDPYNPLRR